jgi:hypothetical protein
MRAEAASVRSYRSPVWGRDYAGLQLFTAEDLLKGKRVDYPVSAQTNVTYKKAPLAKARGEQEELPFAGKKRQRRQ